MSRYKAYPEYKDSGVEWLGSVPQHWNARQLKFICTCNDEVLGESIHPEYEIEYIDIGSVSASEGISKTETMMFSGAPSRARRIVRDGDVIVSTVRTYLEAIASIDNPPPNLIVSTGFAVIRPNQYLHKKFAAYCLRTSGFIKEVIARSVGVSYPAINASDLINIKAPLPQFSEQQKIANFLDHETAKIDTLIAKQQELIKLLKEKRQAVISHAVTKGLNPNAPMRDSGVEWLGEVPAHWDVSMISSLSSKITNGFVGPTRDIFHDEGVRYLQSLHVKNNKIDFHTPYFVTEEWSKGKEKSVLKEGDVLVVQTGDIGQVAAVTKEFEGCNCHALIILSPSREISGFYLSWVLNTDYGCNSLKSIQTGALHPHLNCGYVKNIKVPLPPINEQYEINLYAEETSKKYDLLIAKAHVQITLLYERRTALISAAVTGKIDVRDWQPPSESAIAA